MNDTFKIQKTLDKKFDYFDNQMDQKYRLKENNFKNN